MAIFEIKNGEAIIPEGTTELPDYAFKDCEKLKRIEIPSSVTKIGNYAFSSCKGLTSIKIPNSVKEIGEGAFMECINLTAVELPTTLERIGKYAFKLCEKLESIDIPDSVTEIGHNAFWMCHNLSKVRLSANLSKIESKTFKETPIEEIDIPNSVRIIEGQAFGECYYLHEVRLPNDIEIDDSAFEYCNNLHAADALYLNLYGNPHYKLIKVFPHAFHYSIPDDVVEIGNNVLGDCDNIDSIVIPDSVKKIHEGAFYCSQIKKIKIGNGVTELPARCFFKCERLEEVDIPDSITSIGQSCFADCISIKSIKISDNVTYLGKNGFCGCKNLQNIILGNSIETIMEETFADCEMLSNISLPQSVNFIGKKAFAGCKNLQCITFGNSLENIYEEAFAGCSKLTRISLPQSVSTIGKKAFHDCSLLENVEHSGNISIDIDAFLGTRVKDGSLLPDFKYYGKILPSQWKSDTPFGSTMLKVYRGICVTDADLVEPLIKDIKENGLYIEQMKKFKVDKYDYKESRGHRKLTKAELDNLYSNNLPLKNALEGYDKNQVYFGDYICALNYATRRAADHTPIIIEAEMTLDELNVDGIDSFAHVFDPYNNNGTMREVFGEKIDMYYEKYRAEVGDIDGGDDKQKFRGAIVNMAESDNDIVYAFYKNNRVIYGKACNIFKCAFQAKLPIAPERILSVKVVSNESLPKADISLGDLR